MILTLQVATGEPSNPISESQLIGIWQGRRSTIEYFANHTFKQNELYLPDGMKWRVEGNTLTRIYPDLADRGPSWYPTPGPMSAVVLSLDWEKLVLKWEKFIAVEYRIPSYASSEIDAAAARAKADQDRLNAATPTTPLPVASSPPVAPLNIEGGLFHKPNNAQPTVTPKRP
ncbi:MAG: hypothetical protein QOJ64_2148 [Acidobacteriota bacterium]|jgi:hypothetical protein|nr:hypothetical protein [Acidobacteriota bacterium]